MYVLVPDTVFASTHTQHCSTQSLSGKTTPMTNLILSPEFDAHARD